MAESLSIVIASSLKEQAYRIRSVLDRDGTIKATVKVLGNNGHADPLHGLTDPPELLILILGPAWESELDSLGTQGSVAIPPMIVIAQEGNLGQMRRAMQAGAKDFLGLGVDEEELLKCVRQVVAETRVDVAPKRSGGISINAVVNCKGGSGASFIASSLAHVIAKSWGHRVTLLDLDLQFGVQDLCLDLKPRTSLLQAIELADQLDAVAIEGCMAVHESGVRLLGEYSNTLPLPWEVSRSGLESLLKLAAASYDHVIVDLPRQIDPLTSTVLSASNLVYVVTSQSLIHIRDAKRMLRILMNDLSIQRSRIRFVVNRYDAAAPVTLRDIQSALGVADLVLIPNDYRRASEAMNLGVPVFAKNPGASISKAFVDMAAGVAGAPSRRQSGLRGAIAGLFGQSAER